MVDILEFLRNNNLFTELFVLINTLISWLVISFKVRKSKAEKEYISINKELATEFEPKDYFIIVYGKVYEYDDSNIKIIKKEDYYYENEKES